MEQPNPVNLLLELAEEAQAAANHAMTEGERLARIAQRDALNEARMRLRDGRANPEWIRISGPNHLRLSRV